MPVIEFEDGYKAEFDGEPSQEDIDEVYSTIKRQQQISGYQKETELAQKEAGKSVTRRFGRELVNFGLSAPAKFAVSAGEIARHPLATLQGETTQREYDLPGIDPFKSFQSEAGAEVLSGRHPAKIIGQKAVEVPLAGLETLGLAKVGVGLAKGVPKILGATKGVFAQRAEKRAIESALQAIKPSVQSMSKKEKIALLKQSGLKTKTGGLRGTETKGILNKLEPVTTEKDIEIAQSAARAGVSKSLTPDKNISLLNRKISETANEVRPILEKVKRPFYVNPIKSKFDALKESADPRYIEIFADPTKERALLKPEKQLPT